MVVAEDEGTWEVSCITIDHFWTTPHTYLTFILFYQNVKAEVAVVVEADEEDVVQVELVEEQEVGLILPRQKGVVALQHFLEPK